MLEKDQRKSENEDHETAGERLKRLLSDAKNEQPVESLGDLAKTEKLKSKNLDDTSPIRISKGKEPEINSEAMNGEAFIQDVEPNPGFSEIIKEQYQSIKENLGLIFKKKRSKSVLNNCGSQPPVNGRKNRFFNRFGKNPKSCFLFG